MEPHKTNNTAQEIVETIKSAKRIVTCMDARFDYDSYCAIAVLRTALENFGVKYDAYFDGIIPNVAKELVKEYSIKENVSPASIDFAHYEVMIYLDTGTPNHINKEFTFDPPQNIKKINIDHHFSNSFYGNLNYVYSDESSTCTVLVKLFKEAGIIINGEQEQNILIAMLLDTGFFQHNTTRPQDLRLTADMWERGLNYIDLVRTLTFNDTFKNMRMRAIVFNNLRVDYDNKFAYSFITQGDLFKHDLKWEDITAPPADELKKLSGVNFVFVVTELKTPGLFNISLRSHEYTYSVSPIAERFGGGGHRVAAGANIKVNNIEEAINTVISMARQVENETKK